LDGHKPKASTHEFGKWVWWWPVGMSEEESQDRLLYIHGCHSNCDVAADYYSTMTTRLAKHGKMPVLGVNFAAEPEHPWPNNIRDLAVALEYLAKNGPTGEAPARSIFIAADSEGGIVALHLVMALVDPEIRALFGFPMVLRPEGAAAIPGESHEGSLPLRGLIVISPTIDTSCSAESIHTNCWGDQGEGSGDVAWASGCLPTRQERNWDCQWSYVNYMLGLPVARNIHNRTQAHAAYTARPNTFWNSPQTNPLSFDFSTPGFPSTLIIEGGAEVFLDDAVTLAERMCTAGLDVEQYTPPGMWHDFIEYSEGCGNSEGHPLFEGQEAYRRVEAFVNERRGSKAIFA